MDPQSPGDNNIAGGGGNVIEFFSDPLPHETDDPYDDWVYWTPPPDEQTSPITEFNVAGIWSQEQNDIPYANALTSITSDPVVSTSTSDSNSDVHSIQALDGPFYWDSLDVNFSCDGNASAAGGVSQREDITLIDSSSPGILNLTASVSEPATNDTSTAVAELHGGSDEAVHDRQDKELGLTDLTKPQAGSPGIAIAATAILLITPLMERRQRSRELARQWRARQSARRIVKERPLKRKRDESGEAGRDEKKRATENLQQSDVGAYRKRRDSKLRIQGIEVSSGRRSLPHPGYMLTNECQGCY